MYIFIYELCRQPYKDNQSSVSYVYFLFVYSVLLSIAFYPVAIIYLHRLTTKYNFIILFNRNSCVLGNCLYITTQFTVSRRLSLIYECEIK